MHMARFNTVGLVEFILRDLRFWRRCCWLEPSRDMKPCRLVKSRKCFERSQCCLLWDQAVSVTPEGFNVWTLVIETSEHFLEAFATSPIRHRQLCHYKLDERVSSPFTSQYVSRPMKRPTDRKTRPTISKRRKARSLSKTTCSFLLDPDSLEALQMPRIQSWSEDWASWLKFSWLFSVSSTKCGDSKLRSPRPLYFTSFPIHPNVWRNTKPMHQFPNTPLGPRNAKNTAFYHYISQCRSFWVSLISFAAVTLSVASHLVFTAVRMNAYSGVQ